MNLSVMLQGQVGMGNWFFILLMFAMIAFMWYSQRKQAKKINSFREGLVKGDKVLVNGAICAKVKEVKPGTLIVEIANHVEIEVTKDSVVPDYTDLKAAEKKEEK